MIGALIAKIHKGKIFHDGKEGKQRRNRRERQWFNQVIKVLKTIFSIRFEKFFWTRMTMTNGIFLSREHV